MSNQVIIDDIDSAITYSGGWQEIEGSTRQWGGGTVHSTTQQGASASISFSGTRIKMYCTLFHGLGNEIANINFNGKTSTVSTPSQPQDVFNQIWFDSGGIPSGRYTFVVSNGGGPSDTPFQLDRFVIEGLVVTQQAPPPTSSPPAQSPPPAQFPSPPSTQTQVPKSNPPTTTPPTLASVIGSESDNFAASGPLLVSTLPTTNPGASSVFTSSELLTVGTATAPGQTTVVSIQSIQDVSTTSIEDRSSPTQAVNSPQPASLNTVSRKTPIGAVVGSVIGGLLFLIMLLLGFGVLRRQMKARRHTRLAEETEGGDDHPKSLTSVTPFRLDTRSASTHSLLSPMSDVHNLNSPASYFSTDGYLATVPHGSRRHSIEKLPSSLPDRLRHPSSSLTHGAMTTASSFANPPPHNIFLHMHHNPREQSASSSSLASHHHVGDGISTSASSSFYMPMNDDVSSNIARPPSYHLIQTGN